MKKRRISLLLMLCAAVLCGCVKQSPIPYDIYEGTILTQQGVFIDTESNTLLLGEDAILEFNGTQLSIGGTEFDLNGVRDGDKLYYHTDTQKIYPFDAHQSVYLGIYRKPCFLSQLNMEPSLLFIDGRSAAEFAGLQDMTVACLGDSMTSGSSDTPGYPEFLSSYLGTSSVTSYGASGSCIVADSSDIDSEDDSYISRYSGMDESVDLVLVLGGINDWGYGNALGTPTDNSQDTFFGAVRMLCQGLKEKYPQATIYFFSSPESNPASKKALYLEGTQWEGNTEGYNSIGLRLSDYAQAMQTVCAEEGIPFYSLTEVLSWEIFDGETEYSAVEKTVMVAEAIADHILDNYSA